MSEKIIGYTAGVFDLFHIGHVNLLRNAKSMCDHLIVTVSTDELVKSYKNKMPLIPFEQRIEIVRSCKYVDAVIPQEDRNFFEAWKKMKFNIMFIGGDWYGTDEIQALEKKFKEVGVKVIYLPYTRNISSTTINKILDEDNKNLNKKVPESNGGSNSSIDSWGYN